MGRGYSEQTKIPALMELTYQGEEVANIQIIKIFCLLGGVSARDKMKAETENGKYRGGTEVAILKRVLREGFT